MTIKVTFYPFIQEHVSVLENALKMVGDLNWETGESVKAGDPNGRGTQEIAELKALERRQLAEIDECTRKGVLIASVLGEHTIVSDIAHHIPKCPAWLYTFYVPEMPSQTEVMPT